MVGSHLSAFVSLAGNGVVSGRILCQVMVRERVRVSSLPVELLLWQLRCAFAASSMGGAVSLALLLLARSFATSFTHFA